MTLITIAMVRTANVTLGFLLLTMFLDAVLIIVGLNIIFNCE